MLWRAASGQDLPCDSGYAAACQNGCELQAFIFLHSFFLPSVLLETTFCLVCWRNEQGKCLSPLLLKQGHWKHFCVATGE